MNCNKRNITPQQNVNLTWRETRAWLKTLQLKEKSSEQRRRHIVEMDDAIKAIKEQITLTTSKSNERPRLLTWNLVADVCVLCLYLTVAALAAYEILKDLHILSK